MASSSLLVLAILAAITHAQSVTPFRYWLEKSTVCDNNKISSRWLNDGDVVLVYGKLSESLMSQTCELKFGPSSSATNQRVMIVFETFRISDCNMYLLVEESPHRFFEEDVSTLFKLTCTSKPGRTKFVAKNGNTIQIKIAMLTNSLNYNFMFNITLTKGTTRDTSTGLSLGIVIGIAIFCVLALIGIGCIVMKYVKIVRFNKQRMSMEAGGSYEPQRQARPHHQPLNMSPTIRSSRERYTSMPLLDREANPTQEFHSCIVEASNATGMCTICQRRHQDHAHFASVDADQQLQPGMDEDNNCSLCHRNHEDYAHVVDINGVTHVTNDPVHVTPHGHSHRHGTHEHSHSRAAASSVRSSDPPGYPTIANPGTADLSDDEDRVEDPNYAHNVLVPPSYEMSPPSYDEALSMPKPTSVQKTSDSSLRDPMYQNLDNLTAQNHH